MSEKIPNSEPVVDVWAPIVRLEVTLESVCPSEITNGESHGESEPCDFAPMISVEAVFGAPIETKVNDPSKSDRLPRN
jgi:hypothetical protein